MEPSCAENNWIIIFLKTKTENERKTEKRKLYNDPNIELYLVQTELGSIQFQYNLYSQHQKHFVSY